MTESLRSSRPRFQIHPIVQAHTLKTRLIYVAFSLIPRPFPTNPSRHRKPQYRTAHFSKYLDINRPVAVPPHSPILQIPIFIAASPSPTDTSATLRILDLILRLCSHFSTMTFITGDIGFYVYLCLGQLALVTLLSYPGVLWPPEEDDETWVRLRKMVRFLLLLCGCTWPLSIFYEAAKVVQRCDGTM